MTASPSPLTLNDEMPLTKSGSKVLSSMRSEYGPEKGERIFYATANKKPQLGAKWHGKPRSLGKR